MLKDIADRLRSINPYHFFWISVLLSEIFTFVISSIQCYLRWGFISHEVLVIGAIDALFVPIVVVPIIIYFVEKTKEITRSKDQLIKEIAERRKVEKEIRKEKTFTESALNVLQEIFFVFDADERFLRWNETFKNIMGYSDEEISSMKPTDFFPEEERRRVIEAIATVMKTGYAKLEAMGLTKDGRQIPFEVTGSLLKDREGRIVGVSGTGTDISARKLIEALLKESEAVFRDMAEQSVVGIYIVQDEIFRYVNPKLAEIFGYAVGEIINEKGPEDLVLPEEQSIVRENLRKRISGEIESIHYSVRGIKKNKETIHVEVYGSKTVYKGRPAVIGTLLDITGRKRAEEELKRRSEQLCTLAARLTETEEVERKRLASELHDLVGQNLTALGINLNFVRMKMPEEVPSLIRFRIAESLDLVEQTIETIRGVMADLRPPVLDDYGLLAALRWYASKFSSRMSIAVDVQSAGPVLRLPTSVENSLFRISQEALTNVAKHARATQVTVALEIDSKIVRLVVADNGVGFDLSSTEPYREHGWGLLNMIERARAIGGQCHIDSKPGQGTRVVTEVPR